MYFRLELRSAFFAPCVIGITQEIVTHSSKKRKLLLVVALRYYTRMIGHISGKALRKGENWIIVDTGSVGYKIYLQQALHARIVEHDTVSVWTHLVVRENVLDLYGFETTEELFLFELLISVSGIGPRSSLSLLDTASPASLRKAISTGDTSPLTNVSGVGKKTAEKIVLELKGKLTAHEGEDFGVESDDTEVYEALTSLGYSAQEARKALKRISSDTEDTGARIKEALKILGS